MMEEAKVTVTTLPSFLANKNENNHGTDNLQ
jgi:hypothetical protein